MEQKPEETECLGCMQPYTAREGFYSYCKFLLDQELCKIERVLSVTNARNGRAV